MALQKGAKFVSNPLFIFHHCSSLEAVFDASSRPLEPAFYTGSPAYHNLIYKIYQQSKLLEEAWPDVGGDKKEDERAGEEEDVPEESSRDQSVPMYWMKKSTLADMLAEEISDKQVSSYTHLYSCCCHSPYAIDHTPIALQPEEKTNQRLHYSSD